MKQHEALGLAFGAPLKSNVKLVLLTIIYRLDWETWEKPMSVGYILKALNKSVSRSSISRALVELQGKGVISRHEMSREDGVKLIKLDCDALTTLCQRDIPPMSERHTPYVSVTHPPMSERHTPYVSVTDPLCQRDIPPMSERHTPYVSVTDNIICNNLSTNLSTNLSSNLNDQEPSQEATHQTEGLSQEDSEPNEWGYRDRVKAAQESGDWSKFWGTSSSNEPEPEPQPQPQPPPQPMRYEERARRAQELMHRSYK